MGKYLEDRELDSVLESYFNEGVISKINDHYNIKLKEQQDKLVAKFTDAMKNGDYKYYTIIMMTTTEGNWTKWADFDLYGTNVRPFTKNDIGLTGYIRGKELKAKRVTHYRSRYVKRMQDVPPEIKKYIL